MKTIRITGTIALALVAAFAVVSAPIPAYAGKKFCPPGLAKKGSCIPPGHRKHWKRGEHIPHDVVYQRIYYEEYHLPRPRPGQYYANIGGDIYLLAEATQLVIEAINLIDEATR